MTISRSEHTLRAHNSNHRSESHTMSEATRAIALQEAVKHHGDSAEPSIIVKTAAAFAAFLDGIEGNGASTAGSGAAAAAAPAAPAAPRRGRPPAPAGAPATPQAPPPAAPAASNDDAKKALAAKIGELARKDRPAVVEILKQYGAQSASSVKPEDYEAVMGAIDDALIAY
ncbi:MAG: hypothetical protein KGL39_09650 [Patescibacteria group bacterium]|nr:hypothetical protein [Patescibacteria group bacterium]